MSTFILHIYRHHTRRTYQACHK